MFASISNYVVDELKEAYPQIDFKSPDILHKSLKEVFSQSKVPFVIVIDEWDCIMREKKEDPESLKQY